MRDSNILLVDDDPGMIRLMAAILGDVAPLRFATSGEEALRLARESAPDLVLLDAQMPGLSGFQTCEALRSDPTLADVPVIFVTSHSEPAFEIEGFNAGAVDFIGKPVSPPLVLARVQTQLRLKRMADELRRLSMSDGLTGVANRRRFDEALQREWARVQRSEEPLAVLLIDVDHFKKFNDHYGHVQGDACLQQVARALEGACARQTDLVARYGGEEFAMILPNTALAGAERVAARALEAVAQLRLPHAASPTARHVTVSVGVGCLGDGGEARRGSASELVRVADGALYAAKEAGRAQVQVAEPWPGRAEPAGGPSISWSGESRSEAAG